MDHTDKIKACIAEFPSLDLEYPHFTGAGNTIPPGSASLVDHHLAMLGKRNKASSDMMLSRFPLINAMMQEGRLLEFFSRDPRLFPLK